MTRRQYINFDDVEQYSNITITNLGEAEDQMNHAEELIDSYVGFQDKHIPLDFSGLATNGGNNYLIDTSGDSHLKSFEDDYFIYCEVEIIGGTGKGQVRTIESYNKSLNKIIVSENWDTNPDNTSFYVIRQLGKFPRIEDAYYENNERYYKTIPNAVKQATLAQLDYIISKGRDFFNSAVDFQSESLEGYSYTKKSGKDNFISPTARQLLKGIVNKKGQIIS